VQHGNDLPSDVPTAAIRVPVIRSFAVPDGASIASRAAKKRKVAMLCSDLMKRHVERCHVTALVSGAAATMRDKNVGFLPVCDDTEVVIGTLTDRDIVVRVLAEGLAPGRTRVRDVMTDDVVSCSPYEELAVAEDLMIGAQKSRMICLDPDRRLAGIISLSSIAKKHSRRHAGIIAASVAGREARAALLDRRKGSRVTPCQDVMTIEPRCCRRDDLVGAIAALMRDHNIGFLPVLDEDGTVIGTLTDRDLAIRVVADERPAEMTRAGDVLTPELVFCFPDDPLSVAEDLMVAYKKSRIVCADADRRPLGVISLSDLARIERASAVSRVLREVSSRAAPPTL
jgi:CBS domain-containing protein